jgi:hypothetical protein
MITEMSSPLTLSPPSRKGPAMPCSQEPLASPVIGAATEVYDARASYMKLLDISIGLIVNFHALKPTDGISRMRLRCLRWLLFA